MTPAIVRSAVFALACGCGQPPATSAPRSASTAIYGHSTDLGAIMKAEVNQPFSALMFLVFHSAEQSTDDQPDFGSMRAPTATLRAGIEKVRLIPDPPVQSDEAKQVFFTFVSKLAQDSDTFATALANHDRAGLEDTLNKISKTCNSCHHFFRLDIKDSQENSR